jgi:Icc-related predicted phosphoesterase
LQNLPDADIVVHSGDICMVGSEQEAIDFLNWFCDLPYKNKIFIAGNHDECLYGANIGGLDANCHYLCNSGIEIEGLNFYGVPMFMNDCVYGRQQKNYDKIPDDTDVLITHTPPFGILDFDDNINYGAEELLPIVTRVRPQAHLFGHIHVQHGVKQQDGIIFSNGAIMNSDYTDFNEPNVIEI